MSQKILSLFNYQQGASFSPYIVMKVTKQEGLETLTPDTMEIDKETFVGDLSLVKNYWQQQALQKNQKISEFLNTVIKKRMSHCPLAVFCEHPFQGLVFLNHLKEQDSQGVFDLQSFFAQKVYKNLSWSSWFQSAKQLNQCFANKNCFKKERQSFSSEIKRLKLFIERTDMQEFSALKPAHFYELQRRFKGFIGFLWSWTFPGQDSKDKSGDTLFDHSLYRSLKGFPWHPHRAPEKTLVQHWLEYPLSDWQPLVEPLRQSVKKLFASSRLQGDCQVFQMTWSLVLFDSTVVEKGLTFPHSLSVQKEKDNDYEIVLQQLQRAFDQFVDDLKEREKDLEIINTPFIMGWEITINKSFFRQSLSQCLDPEEQRVWVQQKEKEELSHKILGELRTFETQPHFVTGLDFYQKPLIESAQNCFKASSFCCPKPFYLLSEEKSLEARQIRRRQFLERGGADWWSSHQPTESFRDYFICELVSGEIVFVYRNNQGRWYQYGF